MHGRRHWVADPLWSASPLSPLFTHLLQDGTPEDKGDEVGVSNRREAVGDHDAGASHLCVNRGWCGHVCQI